MPPQRSATTALRKLFDAATDGLYLVEASGTIVFVNAALARWLQFEPNALVGQRCRYHSADESSPGAALAARLCPPPSVFAGERVSTVIALPGENGSLNERMVEMIPVAGSSEAVSFVLGRVTLDAPSVVRSGSSPVDPELVPSDQHAALARHLHRLALRYRFEALLGESLVARRLRAQVSLAAAGVAHGVLVGKPGSGRHHVARTIHLAANDGSANLILPLACPLLEREVLSRSLQAVTRASTSGGPLATLLLLDLDQLALELQATLLDSLSDERPKFRILATASRSLNVLAQQGQFGCDLAALVSTFELNVPSLVERRDDLPLLAQAVLEQVNRESAKQLGGFTPEALDRLVMYSWPGEWDEFHHTIAAAHAAAAGPVIERNDLPERLTLAAQAVERPRKLDERIVLGEFLSQIERELIERALRRTKGNKAKAARLLGLTRPRLYRRMVQLGLSS